MGQGWRVGGAFGGADHGRLSRALRPAGPPGSFLDQWSGFSRSYEAPPRPKSVKISDFFNEIVIKIVKTHDIVSSL